MMATVENPAFSLNLPRGANDSALCSEELLSEEVFSLGNRFRPGRAEEWIALVDAVMNAHGSVVTEPLNREAVPASSTDRSANANPLLREGRPSILIVDDDPINIDLLADTFGLCYDVLAATDGENALEIARREVPDLILLDVIMPGIDGYEVCRRLKSSRVTRNIPVLFITALGSASAETMGLELGAREYLTKPIDIKTVTARVNNQFHLKTAQDKLIRLATFERTLRDNLFDTLASRTWSS